ncbi:MAG: hypothetical protein MUO60_08275 [Clostridiaceae bacterium]|nr:hypothetical protein [Clostridiaceae bacterium]
MLIFYFFYYLNSSGLDYIVRAETTDDAIKSITMTYGGPIALIILGYLLTLVTSATSKVIDKIEE